MSLNVARELAALQKMTPRELREKYAEVHGEESRSGHKEYLIKRIIWRMQANAEGDLSERARQRALELANDSDLRLKAPPPRSDQATKVVPVESKRRATNLIPGTVITREYKGRMLRVTVREDGFEFEGQPFGSLSAVAKAITGTHTSGNLFFRMKGGGQ